jgi:hypothetical protein
MVVRFIAGKLQKIHALHWEKVGDEKFLKKFQDRKRLCKRLRKRLHKNLIFSLL